MVTLILCIYTRNIKASCSREKGKKEVVLESGAEKKYYAYSSRYNAESLHDMMVTLCCVYSKNKSKFRSRKGRRWSSFVIKKKSGAEKLLFVSVQCRKFTRYNSYTLFCVYEKIKSKFRSTKRSRSYFGNIGAEN